MNIYDKVPKEVVVDVQCDICGKSCKTDFGLTECAELYSHWGYASNKDGEKHMCQMCETCYDKVKSFIVEELGGKVEVSLGNL